MFKPDSESEKEFVSSSSLVFISHFLVTPMTVLMLLDMLSLSLSGISAILQSLILLLVSHVNKMTGGINWTYYIGYILRSFWKPDQMPIFKHPCT